MDTAVLAQAFTIANLVAFAGWAVLIALPRWDMGPRLVVGVGVPLLMGAAYLALLALGNFGIFFGGDGPPGGGFGSLEAVMIMFTSPPAVLAGWLHYLAFDLFVGAWEVRDARRLGIPHLLVVPCLLLTFMLGPVGLVAYMLVRLARGKGIALAEG
jgi:hypothetical protein